MSDELFYAWMICVACGLSLVIINVFNYGLSH